MVPVAMRMLWAWITYNFGWYSLIVLNIRDIHSYQLASIRTCHFWLKTLCFYCRLLRFCHVKIEKNLSVGFEGIQRRQLLAPCLYLRCVSLLYHQHELPSITLPFTLPLLLFHQRSGLYGYYHKTTSNLYVLEIEFGHIYLKKITIKTVKYIYTVTLHRIIQIFLAFLCLSYLIFGKIVIIHFNTLLGSITRTNLPTIKLSISIPSLCRKSKWILFNNTINMTLKNGEKVIRIYANETIVKLACQSSRQCPVTRERMRQLSSNRLHTTIKEHYHLSYKLLNFGPQ